MNIIKKVNAKHIQAFISHKKNRYKINNLYKKCKNERKIILMGTPRYGNLGDQAIIVSEIKYIEDNFRKFKFIEVSLDDYYEHVEFIKKYINNKDIIMLHGGGNFGDEYLFEETVRRNVIDNFPNNKIILFPQTIYFKESEKGKKELEVSKNIYNNHNNLTLVAREKISYEKMKKEFNKCNVILTPDIVLYLNEEDYEHNRDGALCCLRSDLESKLTKYQKEFINKELRDKFKKVCITDTVINKNVNQEERNEFLRNKFNEFKMSELVITDRIHGMIFAAITGTPCIALSNYNYKVKGTYEWIKDLGYIKFTDDINEIPDLIQELKNIKNVKYDNLFAIKKYDQIIQCINS